MQTVKLQGFENTVKVITALLTMHRTKNYRFLSLASLIRELRHESKVKVDSAFLRLLIRKSQLKLDPFQYTGISGQSSIEVKQLLLDMFKSRVENNLGYKTMYSGVIPVFSDNIRVRNSDGSFMYPDAESEVEGELLRMKTAPTPLEPVSDGVQETSDSRPTIAVMLNHESLVVSLGSITTIYSGQILYTDNR